MCNALLLLVTVPTSELDLIIKKKAIYFVIFPSVAICLILLNQSSELEFVQDIADIYLDMDNLISNTFIYVIYPNVLKKNTVLKMLIVSLR